MTEPAADEALLSAGETLLSSDETLPGADDAQVGVDETLPASVTGPIEALLLMATEPMGAAELAQAVNLPTPVVWSALEQIATFYDETERGFELRQVGRGWRLYTRTEHADVIARWVLEGQHAKLSQAALETLAVVAYLQPISRSRISAIRGVNVDGVIRTLVTRELIEEAGTSAETGAMLFRTTELFLERMGFTSLDDLPPIAPYLPEASLLEAELAGLAEESLAAASSDAAAPSRAAEGAAAPPHADGNAVDADVTPAASAGDNEPMNQTASEGTARDQDDE